jgi:hypothetical protein
MRIWRLGLIGMICLQAVLQAAPLQKEYISAEAKWLLHADLDNLRQTQIGKHFFTDILQHAVAKPLADLNEKLNLELDLDKIQSLTAYGESYRAKPETDGVLLLRTSMKIDQMLRTVMAQQTNLAPSINMGALKLVQQEPFELFSVEDELFLAPLRSMLVVSQSRTHLDKALQVIRGQRSNLKSGKSLADFPGAQNAFFFLGVAEGFSPDRAKPESDEKTNANDPLDKLAKKLPPQAKILQMADGGRVVLGEKSENVFCHLTLKTKTAESATQIQQVLQGMSALLALSKANDPSFYLPPLNITTENRTVLINVDYPVAKLLHALDDFDPPKAHRRDRSPTPSSDSKTQPESTEN